MSLYDLTGENVSDTYHRVVQTISGSLYDGLGNAIALQVSGTVDYSNILNVPNGIISSSNQLPSGLISSSTQLPSGIISSSAGFLSSSTQIASEISGAFTSVSASLASEKLDKIGSGVYSSSVQLPSGIISSSLQFPSGLISSSTQLPIGILSSSIQIAAEISGAFTIVSSSLASEKLDKIGSNIYSSSMQLPSGIISSSTGFISSSAQISTEISGAFILVSSSLASEKLDKIGSNVYSSSLQLPSGIISGSTQLPIGIISSSVGFLSSSAQIASDISGSIGNFSSSVATQLNTINSKLIDSFGIVIQGGASDIVTGSKNIYRAKQSGQLTAIQMDSYAYGTNLPISGTIGIHVTRNGITMGTASMSSTASFFDSTLTGWNKTTTIFDKIEYSVLNNSSIKNITLTLFYNIN